MFGVAAFRLASMFRVAAFRLLKPDTLKREL